LNTKSINRKPKIKMIEIFIEVMNHKYLYLYVQNINTYKYIFMQVYCIVNQLKQFTKEYFFLRIITLLKSI
jgi:hypothetical protein